MNTNRKPIREIIRDKRTWEAPSETPPDGDNFATPFRGWYTRGKLPHCDKPGLIQFISYRLFDSMPVCRQHEWRELLEISDDHERVTKVESYLDAGYGACFLGLPDIAKLIEDNWLHFDGERYRLLAWIIMPNHVHLVCDVWKESLPRIVKSWKSYSATRANKFLDRIGEPFWQAQYFDRYVRDEDHFNRAIRYVEMNPVKAGLVKTPEEWAFSSANPKWQWSAGGLTERYNKAQLIKCDKLAAVTSRAPSIL